MEKFGIVLFYSTHDAMAAEELAKKKQMKVRIIPTPEKIYASCGFSLKYPLETESVLRTLFIEHDIKNEGFYHAVRDGLKTAYEPVKENG